MKLLKSILVFVCLLFLVFANSCKKENCFEYYIRELDQDTALIFYDGYETLKFVIEDSVGIFLDSVTFKGVGKRKYILGDDRKMQPCGDILHDHQNMDYMYFNTKDSQDRLILTLRKKMNRTDLYLRTPSKYQEVPFEVRVTALLNPNFSLHHDTITIKGKLYNTVVQLTKSGQKVKSAYFGRYDGILLIEETTNRIWYAVK